MLELTTTTAVSMTIGVLVSCRVIDYWVKLKSVTNQMTPEQRLPLMILGGVLLPAGLFIFGVCASHFPVYKFKSCSNCSDQTIPAAYCISYYVVIIKQY